jgi:hypothetical protein
MSLGREYREHGDREFGDCVGPRAPLRC